MREKILTSILVTCFALCLLALTPPLFAADQPFYEGKTIRFIIRRIRTTTPRPLAKTLACIPAVIIARAPHVFAGRSKKNVSLGLLYLCRAGIRHGVERAIRRVLRSSPCRFNDIVHSFQRGDVLRLEAGDVGTVPLVGIRPCIGGIHIRRLLKNLGNARLVFRTILETGARGDDELSYCILVFLEIIAIDDSHREDRRGVAFGQLFPLVHYTSKSPEFGVSYLSDGH